MGMLGPPSRAELKVLSSGKGPGFSGCHPNSKKRDTTVVRNTFAEVANLFFTKSVRSGRTELSLRRSKALREI